jgi:hypothetical protein
MGNLLKVGAYLTLSGQIFRRAKHPQSGGWEAGADLQSRQRHPVGGARKADTAADREGQRMGMRRDGRQGIVDLDLANLSRIRCGATKHTNLGVFQR